MQPVNILQIFVFNLLYMEETLQTRKVEYSSHKILSLTIMGYFINVIFLDAPEDIQILTINRFQQYEGSPLD